MISILSEDKMHIVLSKLKDGKAYSVGTSNSQQNAIIETYQELWYEHPNFIYQIQSFANNQLTTTKRNEMTESELTGFIESGKISLEEVFDFVYRD